jgi:hypothetical protein
MKTFLNHEFALEAQEDHVEYLRTQFYWFRVAHLNELKSFTKEMEAIVLKAERFYPNRPTTLKMRADFDQLKEQP